MAERSVHSPTVITVASPEMREVIYRARHRVYAVELGQHARHPAGRLTDGLDSFNDYLVAARQGELAGFISITPPGGPGYSIDKYFAREELPFAVDEGVYEFRLLTVLEEHRQSDLALALMMAALRWVEARGGTRIVAIGRKEILDMYRKGGLQATGQTVQSGAVTYELLHAPVAAVRAAVDARPGWTERIENTMKWRLGIPLRKPAGCFHGGAFFEAVGVGFGNLRNRESIIAADVLDAWFPPAPGVIDAMEDHMAWLLGTSPPTGCEGLGAAIAKARGVPASSILPGAGSSDLIFRAFPRWLDRRSRVLLDPTYGEYLHILQKVIGCQVERLPLAREDEYAVNLERLGRAMASGPDLVVLVNPNSPTGQTLTREEIRRLLALTPKSTRVWIDETYIDYVEEASTVEPLVKDQGNLIVCKSMSKAYGLSGARVGYLCAGPHHLEELRAYTPPWVVGLPAQVAAVRALEDLAYYCGCWAETRRLRSELAQDLIALGWEVMPGCANFVFAHLPASWPSARDLVEGCRRQGLFLRDAAAMGSGLGDRAIRIAVKDRATNEKMVSILKAFPRKELFFLAKRPGRFILSGDERERKDAARGALFFLR